MSSRYNKILNECHEIAINENREAKEKLNTLHKKLTTFQRNLVNVRHNLRQTDIDNNQVTESVEKVVASTTELLEEGFLSFYSSLDKKSKNLADFTVTLFGRTKAGKSTIREALTGGDGSTIGKGGERTTLDVREYRWNNLRVLDTPGFDAYNGEEDTAIAFSQVDQTDLILFLVTSDSIQESEFEKLAQLKQANKPVIIILNVLLSLENSVHKKRFLSNPQKDVSIKGQQGNIERLKSLAKQYFNLKYVTIIPIHALSAYQSTTTNDKNEKDLLYKASNFEYLKKEIVKEIEVSGKQKRLLTFSESYIYHLETCIKPVYENAYNNLSPIVKLLKSKQSELSNWFNIFIKSKDTEIRSKVENMFNPLFSNLNTFIEENIEKDDFSLKWNKYVNNTITSKRVQDIQDGITEDLNSYLNQFFKEFEFDLKFSLENSTGNNIDSIKKGYSNRIIKWGLVIGGTILSFFNPVGWVGLAIGILGSLFTPDQTDEEIFSKQKENLRKRLYNNLDKTKRKYTGSLTTWFYESITKGLKKKIEIDLKNQIKSFIKLLQDYSLILSDIDELIEKENISLIKKLIHLQDNQWNGNIVKLVRCRGAFIKILVDKPLFNDFKQLEKLKRILGENVIVVNLNDDRFKVVLDALNIDYTKVENVQFDTVNSKYIVKVQKGNKGRVIGRKGKNIVSASQLINYRIDVLEV